MLHWTKFRLFSDEQKFFSKIPHPGVEPGPCRRLFDISQHR